MIAVRGVFTGRRGSSGEGQGTRGIAGWLARFGIKTKAGQVDVKPVGLTGELGGRRVRDPMISGAGVSVAPIRISEKRVAKLAPRGYK